MSTDYGILCLYETREKKNWTVEFMSGMRHFFYICVMSIHVLYVHSIHVYAMSVLVYYIMICLHVDSC